MMRQMLTHQKDDWGLGFGLESRGHKLRFGHGGANEGFRCDLEAYTESGQGIAIMTNSDSGDQLTSEFLRAVAKEYNWLDFQATERIQVRWRDRDPVHRALIAGRECRRIGSWKTGKGAVMSATARSHANEQRRHFGHSCG